MSTNNLMARCNQYFFIAKFYEQSFGSFYDGKKIYLKDVTTSAIPSVVDSLVLGHCHIKEITLLCQLFLEARAYMNT